MKKTFNLKVENKHPDRQVESIKHEIRKYIKREKKKTLDEEFDFWKFDCKFAKNDNTPEVIDFTDITKCIDEAASENCDTLYMEILKSPAKREAKPAKIEEEIAEEINEEV